MRPAKIPPLAFVQGDDYSRDFRIGTQVSNNQIEYYDLTSWVGKSQIRLDPSHPDVLAECTVTTDAVGFTLSLTAEQTAILPATTLSIDVEFIEPGGNKRTWIATTVEVIPEVTRP